MNSCRLLGAAALLLLLAHPGGAQPLDDAAGAPAGYEPLVEALETAMLSGDPSAYIALAAPAADRDAAARFANEQVRPGVDRVTATTRFEAALDGHPEGDGYRVMVELFFESGARGRLETWRLDLVRVGEDAGRGWRILDQDAVDSIDNLRHLRLTPTTQYMADDLVVTSEDLTLTLTTGSAFVAETENGVTGLVLLGDGVMRFAPQPEAERRQVEIFSGGEALEAEFESAFVRLHPDAFRTRASTGALRARGVNPGALRDAEAVLDEFVSLSFTLDLSDISDRVWSLPPGRGDFLAEVRTEDHGTLTYIQSLRQPEDISLFEREANRIVSLYASARKRATRGRYFGDDDALSLDILDYEITASFEPLDFTQQRPREARQFVDCRIVGTTRIAARVKGLPITSFSLRLADDLAVRSVTSAEFGPLLFFRMNGQNNLVVNLPEEVGGGAEFTVTVTYEGDLSAQELDENWIGRQRVLLELEPLFGLGEPRYIYSNRSYWYPQSLVTDYATATLDLSVPAGWGVVASGAPARTNPPVAVTADPEPREYSFTALQPARYLSAVISRFEDHPSPSRQIRLDAPAPPSSAGAGGGVFYGTLAIDAYGTPRSTGDIDETAERAADIAAFYASLLGDIPYPSMTVALTDSRLPGGHSPAYFALMNHELPRQPGTVVTWQTDPVSFSGYPSFFLAHEVAHQWWGQAVGWKNYHEQWLSEGLAQYFAALYAEHDEGPEAFEDIIERMRSWAMRHSDEGPVYLGYRLGHLEREPRIFRALVYNKGAMVLHMLRRLVGDDAFFAGLRRFYHEWRFRKAGTDALQLAFEIEAGRSLSRFFDRWIHEAALPEVRFSSRTERTGGGNEVLLRFEQLSERLFDLPVTVTVQYRSGEEESVVVPVVDRVTEHRLPARGPVRRISVNRDRMALANIDD
jgi:hypothetical protein